MGEWLYYNFATKSYHTKKLYIRLYLTEIEIYSKKSILEPPFGYLWVTYALSLYLIAKPVVNFLFIITERFCYLLRLRHKRKSVIAGILRRGCVTLSANFRRKRGSSTNYCWYQKTMIALSCGIKISALHCFVL